MLKLRYIYNFISLKLLETVFVGGKSLLRATRDEYFFKKKRMYPIALCYLCVEPILGEVIQRKKIVTEGSRKLK